VSICSTTSKLWSSKRAALHAAQHVVVGQLHAVAAAALLALQPLQQRAVAAAEVEHAAAGGHQRADQLEIPALAHVATFSNHARTSAW
jgi:hypothetical protein